MSIRRMTVIGLATLGVLAWSTGVAQASITQIGSFGMGEITESPFFDGIAVDQDTGDVYVADASGNRVVEFTGAGAFILMFGEHVNKTKVQANAGEAEENICTAVSGDECQPGAGGYGAGQFNLPEGIAWDPVSGDVYVADRSAGAIQRFTPAGEYISQIDGGVGGVPEFSLPYQDASFSIAVDGSGNLYALEERPGGLFARILEFNAAGVYTGVEFINPTGFATEELDTASGMVAASGGALYVSGDTADQPYHAVLKFNAQAEVTAELDGGFATEGHQPGWLTLNLYNDDLFVQNAEQEVLVYDPEGKQIESFAFLRGPMAYGTLEGRLYVVERNEGSDKNEVSIFGAFPAPSSAAPAVVDEGVSAVRQTSGTLEGAVNPNSLATTYTFEYTTDVSFAGATTAPATPASVGSSFLAKPVSASLSGLQPSTVYYYRVSAHNAFGGGSTVLGPTRSFVTAAPPPTPTTGGVTSVGQSSATLTGVVVPGGVGVASDTRWCFEYGTGQGYGLGFTAPLDAGQGTAQVPVDVGIDGLQPDTLYHYRLVAVDSVGVETGASGCGTSGGEEVFGADATFMTAAPVPPVVSTGGASEVTPSTAALAGTVDPRGSQTTYEFQVGVDTSYGVQVFAAAGAGSEPESVGTELSALQPGTTYHYRLVASNAGGTSFGADSTFTTPVVAAASLAAPASAALLPVPAISFPAPAGGASSQKQGGVTKAKAQAGAKVKRHARRSKRKRRSKYAQARAVKRTGKRGGR